MWCLNKNMNLFLGYKFCVGGNGDETKLSMLDRTWGRLCFPDT